MKREKTPGPVTPVSAAAPGGRMESDERARTTLRSLAADGYEAQAAALAPDATEAPVQTKPEATGGASRDAEAGDTAPLGPPDGWTLKTVQGLLAQLGYDPGPIDGLIGPCTRAAMAALLGLPAGAPVSDDTAFRQRLHEAVASGRGAGGSGGDARGWDLRTVQAKLAELGYDPGPIDGLMGPRTQAAMAALLGLPPGTRVADDAAFRAQLREAAASGGRAAEAKGDDETTPLARPADGDEAAGGGGSTVVPGPPDANPGETHALDVFVAAEGDPTGVPNMDTPVAGARIELVRPNGEVDTTATTGADGMARLAHRIVGPATVRATRGAIVVERELGVADATAMVSVVAPDPNPIEVFVSGDDLGGGAPNMDAPVAGAKVELLRPDGSVVAAGASGGDGRVTLMNTYSGSARGAVRVTRGAVVVTRDEVLLDATASIGVVAPEPNPIDIFVSGDDLGGGAPAMDAPVAGAQVELLRPDGSLIATGTSGADGRVTLMNTFQGRGMVRVTRGEVVVTRDDYLLAAMASIAVVAPEPNPLEVFVSREDLGGGAPNMDAPVAGARVEIVRPDGSVAAASWSDAAGRVTLMNTVQGAGELRATGAEGVGSRQLPALEATASVAIVLS